MQDGFQDERYQEIDDFAPPTKKQWIGLVLFVIFAATVICAVFPE